MHVVGNVLGVPPWLGNGWPYGIDMINLACPRDTWCSRVSGGRIAAVAQNSIPNSILRMIPEAIENTPEKGERVFESGSFLGTVPVYVVYPGAVRGSAAHTDGAAKDAKYLVPCVCPAGSHAGAVEGSGMMSYRGGSTTSDTPTL